MRRTPVADILDYIIPLLYLPVFTIWVSATKQASHTHKLSTAWVSATKQASHTHKLSIAWVSATKQASHTHKLFTLRRKKGTEELVSVSCAHVEAEEGYREAWRSTFIGSSVQWATLFIRLSAKGTANLISYRGVRRITAKVKTVICEQAPNHGSYFAYARLIARVTFKLHYKMK